MEQQLMKFFKENKVAIQITLDIGEDPTVHAFRETEGVMKLHKTSSKTLKGALEKMKEKLFG